MNNLFSYCGLIAARISASDKHLPVPSNKRAPKPSFYEPETQECYLELNFTGVMHHGAVLTFLRNVLISAVVAAGYLL